MSYSIIRGSVAPPAGEVIPKALYFIRAAQGAPVSIYISDADGLLHPCFDDAKMAAALETSTRSFGEVLVTPTIASRNALSLNRNAIVMVEDASADPNVGPSSAFYFYMKVPGSFVLLLGGKRFRWSDISNGPTVSPAEIDSAVARAHSHVNKTVLDGFTDVSDALLYKGKPVGTVTFGQQPEW